MSEQLSMITKLGMDRVNEARPNGMSIDIAFWVPVYDYRIDPDLSVTNNSFSNTDITTVTDSNDTVPAGEVYWNLDGEEYYQIDNINNYLVSGGIEYQDDVNTIITNYLHRNVAHPVLVGDNSVIRYGISAAGSNYYYASTVSAPGEVSTEWVFYNGAQETNVTTYEPTDPSRPDPSKLYSGVFYDESDSTCSGDMPEGDTVGKFQATVSIPKGSIKFNKVGLYGVMRSEAGVIVSNPFLLGQVIYPQPQILEAQSTPNTNFSVSQSIVDFSINISAVNVDFGDITYASDNYWESVTSGADQIGLYHNGTMFVSNTLGVEDKSLNLPATAGDVGPAKGMFATYHTINNMSSATERDMHQLCLQYTQYPYTVSGDYDDTDRYCSRNRTTLRTTSAGDMEFDMYTGCNDDGSCFIPINDRLLGLGKRDNKWKNIFISDNIIMYPRQTHYTTSANNEDFYLNIDLSAATMSVNNGSIYCGPHYTSADVNTTKLGYEYFYGNISSYVSTATDNTRVLHNFLQRSFADTAIVNVEQGYENFRSGESLNVAIEAYDTISHIGEDKIHIVSDNIWTLGTLVPKNGDNLGAINNVYKNLYVRTIRGYEEGIQFEGNILPTFKNYKITDDTFTWGEIAYQLLNITHVYLVIEDKN